MSDDDLYDATVLEHQEDEMDAYNLNQEFDRRSLLELQDEDPEATFSDL